MPNDQIKTHNPSPMLFLYFILLCVVWLAPFWPIQCWWLANLLEIVPLWVLFIPLGLFILTGTSLRSRAAVLISIASFLIILFGIMGFKLSFPVGKSLPGQAPLSLKVITANMGNVKDPALFLQLVASERPDVIAFQELSSTLRDHLRGQLTASGWDWSSKAGLELASRFKIRSMEVKNRRPFGRWGDIVAQYELETSKGPVYFFNVHLATPRDGVEAIMARQPDAIQEMQRVTAMQEQESSLAVSFARPFKPVLVAGDFNMLDTNPLFKAYWSKYRDTFSDRGYGFGYTKHTRWHGARIDHILHDAEWQTLEARCGPDIGGDHHPMIAKLILTIGNSVSPDLEKKVPVTKVVDITNSLVYEPFESSPGKFADNSDADLSLDSKTTFGYGLSLRITTRTLSEHMQAGLALNDWELDAFSAISFYYLIPPQTPVALRVKTAWGDWLCLGGTSTSRCPSAKAQPEIRLIDDGAWHTARIDVRAAVQSVLPMVRSLKEFQFFNAKDEHRGEHFWIDEFRIFAP